MGRMLTPSEVADRLRIDRETVYRQIRAGTLQAARIGRSYRIDEAVLNELVASSRESQRSQAASEPVAGNPGAGAWAIDSPPVASGLTPQQRARAIQLVASWRAEANNPEHAESWDFLRKALDEDRLSGRRLFS